MERSIADGLEGTGEGHIDQLTVIKERICSNSSRAVPQCDGCVIGHGTLVGVKYRSHIHHSVRLIVVPLGALERVFIDKADRAGEIDVGQLRAPLEGRSTDCGDGVGNGDAFQTGATVESLVSNRGDARGDGDVGQSGQF